MTYPAVKEPPYQLVASKAEKTVSIFQSKRTFTLPSLKPKVSLFKESFNIDNKDIDRSIYFSKKPRYIDFKPYNLGDFNKITPKSYQLLGGLGPVNIGREEWVENTKKCKLAKEYSRSVRELNMRI